jgi:hypothetical protein
MPQNALCRDSIWSQFLKRFVVLNCVVLEAAGAKSKAVKHKKLIVRCCMVQECTDILFFLALWSIWNEGSLAPTCC